MLACTLSRRSLAPKKKKDWVHERVVKVKHQGRKLIKGKSPIFTLELSQKSDFQPSTTKPDNIGHPTVKT